MESFKVLYLRAFVSNVFIKIQANDKANFEPMTVPYNFEEHVYKPVS